MKNVKTIRLWGLSMLVMLLFLPVSAEAVVKTFTNQSSNIYRADL